MSIKRKNARRSRNTELGLEILCARCQEYWPADLEFFHKKGDGLHSYCRACVNERCYELRGGLSGWAYQARQEEQADGTH